MKNSFPLSTALRSSIKGYNLATFRQDFLAAFVVSLIALPLSMALAIAVGLPPQHGLYTAVIAGIVVPLLGGSMWQVSGPTAAFVVILAPIVTDHGLRGIVWAGLMAGIMLVALGYARLGRLIHYIPYPVTTGFTAGIAVVLATLSLNDFLGLGITKLHGEYLWKLHAIVTHLPQLDPYTAVVACITLLLLFTANRVIPIIPSAVIAVIFATVASQVLAHFGHDMATIGSKFSYLVGGVDVPGIPPHAPMLHLPTLLPNQLYTWPSFAELRMWLFPAFTIAVLAGLESLLSATVADSMMRTKHDPNAELCGIGIGNILTALAAGIPATGAIARTAAIINNGAKTPLASAIHAGLIMLYMILLSPLINDIPMAALAAILINTAYRMGHFPQFIQTIKIAPRSDVIVLLLCFLLTVFVDMVAGVGAGVICAALLLVNRMTELTRVEVANGEDTTTVPDAPRLPQGTMLYRISGPLFFGNVEKVFDRYHFAHDYINQVIIDLSDVPFVDMTGLVAIKALLVSIAHEARRVHIVCNNAEVHDTITRKLEDHDVKKFVAFYPSITAVLPNLANTRAI